MSAPSIAVSGTSGEYGSESTHRSSPQGWRGSHYLSLYLGNPSRQMLALGGFLGPFRMLLWLCLPVALAGFLVMFKHQNEMVADLSRSVVTVGYWTNLLISLFIISFMVKLCEGVVMGYYRSPPEEFGVRMLFGIWPRFYITRRPITQLDYRRQRNVYLAPALFRLMLFSVGILVWIIARRSGTGLSTIALVLSNAGFLTFLTSSNPIWHADGYRVLASQFQEPKLREHALMVLGRVLTFRPLPKELTERQFWALFAWGAASVVFTLFSIFTMLQVMEQTLTTQLKGLGAIIMLLIAGSMLLYLLVAGPKSTSTNQNAKNREKYIEQSRQDRERIRKMATIMAAKRAERANAPPAEDAALAGASGVMAMTEPVPPPEPQAPPPDEAAPGPSRPEPPEHKPRGGKKAGRPVEEQRSAPARIDSLDDILSVPVAPAPGKSAGAPSEDVSSLLDSVFSDGPREGQDDLFALDEIGLDDPEMGLDMSDLWTDPPLSGDAEAASAGLAEPSMPSNANPAGGPATGFVAAGAAAAATGFSGGNVTGAPAARAAAPRRSGRDPLADLDRVLQMGDSKPTMWTIWRKRLIWIAVIATLVFIAFLPYPYSVGGSFTIAPLSRSETRARIDGEIVAVNVRQGDWVKEGDVLAILSDWNQTHDLAINQSDAAKLAANLQTMLDGATPEEIGVARQNVVTAEVSVRTASQNLERQEALFKSGTISRKVVEDARDAYDAAVAVRDAAQAQLNLVSAPSRQTDIDAQRASIDRNSADLQFAQTMLDSTRLRATTTGQIASDLSLLPIGAHLAVGGLFSVIENNRTVIASVSVPETSIADVRLGADVELRLWSNPLEQVLGKVKFIAPKAELVNYVQAVRVDVEVPNPDGRLQTNMTGFGKIRADDRPVWEAFTQTIIGFFRVELWSWIP